MPLRRLQVPTEAGLEVEVHKTRDEVDWANYRREDVW